MHRILLGATALGLWLAATLAMANSSYVTGVEWRASSENEKLAYVMGIANTINAERAVQVESARPPTSQQSAIPQTYEGLSRETLNGVVDAVDEYFSENPDAVGDTILDVLWLIYVEE